MNIVDKKKLNLGDHFQQLPLIIDTAENFESYILAPPYTKNKNNNYCFSINTQVITCISKKRKKKHFNAKSSSLTVAKRLLVAILSVEVIIG